MVPAFPGRLPHVPGPRPHALNFHLDHAHSGAFSGAMDPRAGRSRPFAAIALHRLGQRADLGERITGAAQQIFDDTCGSVPISVLISILLHRPPPPPPWLQQITFLVETARLTRGISQAEGIDSAAKKQLEESLKTHGSAQR